MMVVLLEEVVSEEAMQGKIGYFGEIHEGFYLGSNRHEQVFVFLRELSGCWMGNELQEATMEAGRKAKTLLNLFR